MNDARVFQGPRIRRCTRNLNMAEMYVTSSTFTLESKH
jgi:hypothetical protein